MSPLSKYFGGKGHRVMESMRSTYGHDKGERVFYATANSKRKKRKKKKKSKKRYVSRF